MRKIEVVKSDDHEGKFFLRVYLSDRKGETGPIRFETNHEFSKPEADCRAMLLSMAHGFDRGDLPTHEQVQADPKEA